MKTVLSSRRHHYCERLGILLLVVALTTGMTGCSCTNGDNHPGEPTETTETEITNWNDLNAIRDDPEGSYVLMNNLDKTTKGYEELVGDTADERGWQPIGSDTDPFKGEFDGNGHMISDLFIDRPGEDNVGLFGYVLEPALIENVGLVSVNVTGNKSVGALVGYSWGGTLYSDSGSASKTYSRGSVTGEEDVGGLVGNNHGGIVNQCESSADVFHLLSTRDEKRWRAGGLVGLNGGTVLNCNYNGKVNGDRQVGGLVGHNALTPRGVVQDCGGTYSVYGNLEVGGVAGRNLGSLTRASFDGTVKAFLLGDGLIALNEGATGNAYSFDAALQGSYVGGVVGVNEGTVEDCSADVTVVGYQYVGGAIGANLGNVSNCSSSGGVTGDQYAGRLVGYNTGTVSNSQSTSCVSEAHNCGPLVGLNDGLVRYNLTISSTVGGEAAIPGEGTFAYDEDTVVNLAAEAEEGYHFVKWTGDVATIGNVNAAMTSIVMNDNCEITANFAPAEVPAEVIEIRDWYDLDAVRDNLGGSYLLMNDLDATTDGYDDFVGDTVDGKGWQPIGSDTDPFKGEFDGNGHTISDLFIYRPDEYFVGLFSTVDEEAVIENIGVVNANVTGYDGVGGLIGLNWWGTVSNSYFTGNVAGDCNVGGLVGQNMGTVGDSYSNGNVNGNVSGISWSVGGLVGYNGGTVSSSYSTAGVVSDSNVGGLVGENGGDGTVSNSYSSGSVAGDYYVGGLVGWNVGSVSNSYSTGSATGEGNVGGLVGGNRVTVSNSFWDIETSGQATSAGGTGKTTAEMKDIITFLDAGWDIVAVANPDTRDASCIWNIVDGQTYPFLSWEPIS